jgi:hypothetical protein
MSDPFPTVVPTPPHGGRNEQEGADDMTSDPVPAVSPPRPVDPEAPAIPVPAGLTRREHEMLLFERQWWRRAGAKDTAIRTRFEMPPTRYYQALNALVDRPAALAADPLVVGRLRRVRAARHRRRSSEVLGKGSYNV